MDSAMTTPKPDDIAALIVRLNDFIAIDDYVNEIIRDAADALVAQQRRIAELEVHCQRLGQGSAERYWEGRWRDADKRIAELDTNWHAAEVRAKKAEARLQAAIVLAQEDRDNLMNKMDALEAATIERCAKVADAHAYTADAGDAILALKTPDAATSDESIRETVNEIRALKGHKKLGEG
jgi:hypothetical protein